MKISKNDILFQEALKHLVGGVNSPVRSFNSVGGNPILAKRARREYIYDYDDKRYIDYVMSWGASILGHSHPDIVSAIRATVGDGIHFGLTNKSEVDFACAIKEAIPSIGNIRFVNSGTEAVMGAVRLARGVSGRDKILKFDNSYHGHADYLLVKGGSGLATLNISSSAGVPEDFIKHTIVAAPDDRDSLSKIFLKYGNDIAGVLVEPVGGNFGVIKPDIDFLKFVRKITSRYGALLICDEVITGFRFRYGSISDEFGIRPDIICLGKIIGGGLPIGAYGASKEIMRRLSPDGDVYQASTFSGNPVVMRSGLAALNVLMTNSAKYNDTFDFTTALASGLITQARAHCIDLSVPYFRNIFSIDFGNKKLFSKFYNLLLNAGIYFAPSEYEANFLSFSHTEKDIKYTLKAAQAAFSKLQ